jgi:hypothetical protein
MYDNEIEVIEDDALERSENTLLVLHIYNNKLTLLPSVTVDYIALTGVRRWSRAIITPYVCH